MALKGLKNIFNPDDMEDNEEYEIKESTKSSNNKEYKNKTILVEPRAFSEAQQIADYLKAKNQVVVNFKRVTSDVSKRIMDFLNGIVICAPKGFEIEGNISEESAKKPASKKDNLGEW